MCAGQNWGRVWVEHPNAILFGLDEYPFTIFHNKVKFILVLSLGLGCRLNKHAFMTCICMLQCLYFIDHSINRKYVICCLGEFCLECSTQCVFVDEVGVKCSTICAHI